MEDLSNQYLVTNHKNLAHRPTGQRFFPPSFWPPALFFSPPAFEVLVQLQGGGFQLPPGADDVRQVVIRSLRSATRTSRRHEKEKKNWARGVHEVIVHRLRSPENGDKNDPMTSPAALRSTELMVKALFTFPKLRGPADLGRALRNPRPAAESPRLHAGELHPKAPAATPGLWPPRKRNRDHCLS